jgi:hypothetical protein
MSQDQIQREFLAGAITSDDAIDMLQVYCGFTEHEAQDLVTGWEASYGM